MKHNAPGPIESLAVEARKKAIEWGASQEYYWDITRTDAFEEGYITGASRDRVVPFTPAQKMARLREARKLRKQCTRCGQALRGSRRSLTVCIDCSAAIVAQKHKKNAHVTKGHST